MFLSLQFPPMFLSVFFCLYSFSLCFSLYSLRQTAFRRPSVCLRALSCDSLFTLLAVCREPQRKCCDRQPFLKTVQSGRTARRGNHLASPWKHTQRSYGWWSLTALTGRGGRENEGSKRRRHGDEETRGMLQWVRGAAVAMETHNACHSVLSGVETLQWYSTLLMIRCWNSLHAAFPADWSVHKMINHNNIDYINTSAAL